MTPPTTVPPVSGVLTAEFPPPGEIIGFIWGHIFGALSANLLLTGVGLVALVLFYVGYVFRSAVTSV